LWLYSNYLYWYDFVDKWNDNRQEEFVGVLSYISYYKFIYTHPHPHTLTLTPSHPHTLKMSLNWFMTIGTDISIRVWHLTIDCIHHGVSLIYFNRARAIYTQKTLWTIIHFLLRTRNLIPLSSLFHTMLLLIYMDNCSKVIQIPIADAE
jgi:hypothetical protein